MKITNIKINGIINPVGFAYDSIRCSWLVRETRAKKSIYSKIEVSTDEDFRSIIYVKKGIDLDSAGEVLAVDIMPRTRYFIKIQVTGDNGEQAQNTQTAYFETGKMQEPWQGKWLKPRENGSFHPLFEKNFQVDKPVKSARLYISGVGLYAACLNESKVGEEVLTPYYSDYHTECQYQTYDITADLKSDNRLSVMLGNGWYKGRFGLAGQSENFGKEFMLIAEIHLLYENGEDDIIASDETWLYKGSDTEMSDIYDGEIRNLLLWEDRENPFQVPCIGQMKGELTERYSLPVMEKEDIAVKEIIHTPAGETVLDFGQNFAGYVSFHARLKRGRKILLDFGEILQEGSFYNENYRSAKSRFVYVSDGREEWVKPLFTFFGFRYVRVTGWPGDLAAEDFIGKAIYSDMQITGNIETDHNKVNRLISNAFWGQKSNSIDFPTDCPQRDERLGWTGDAQVFSGTASYNMDTAAFYHKFLHDLRTEQKKLDGILPGVIPVFDPKSAIFSSIWGDIATFLPMVLYEHYGDIEALKSYFPMMTDWVNKITREDQKRGQKYLFDFGNQLGDWLALDGRTAQSMKGGTDDYYIASCYYAESVKKTADAAEALGMVESEIYYRDLYKNIHEAILKEYFTASGRLSIDTQTGYIVSLYFGIYREKGKIVEGLRNRLYKDCYQLKGGFVGAPVMCRVMAENGMVEEAFYFLLQEGYPGWLHCIDLGATTIWERWNSVLDNGKLSGIMMNSLNHYSFGAVVEYLYRDVAGIKAQKPGFRKAKIAPLMNQKLGYMKASYDSVYGRYRSEWRIQEDGSVHVLIEIPFGCSALVELPFWPDEPIGELDTGVYDFHYQPTEDLRCRYTRKTLFKEMMQDEKAMEIIDRISPLLQHFLGTGDEEFLNESLETLKGMSFLGFSESEMKKLSEELTMLL